ncbi:MAG: hypothetical protein JWO08_1453 [Verrucomicrobiaceae bacterium]|nr:hypothetical protein [Verrucomicrobiaceae bacterium]
MAGAFNPMLLPFILLYIALLALLAVVSATETATFAVSDAPLKVGRMKAGRLKGVLQTVLSNPIHHLHRTLLVSAALNLALTALGMFLIVGHFGGLAINSWVCAGGLFVVSVILGDVLPKFIAARAPGRVLLLTTRLLHPIRVLLDPVTLLAERASDRMLLLFIPKGVKARQPLTRDELETLIEMREEQGTLDPTEAAIINEILEVTELTVRDCMVPRVDLTLIEGTDPEDDINGTLEEARTRFAIIHGDTPDSVQGVIDVWQWKLAGRPAWAKVMQAPLFVPETFPALDALSQHLTSASKCVLITDEYGGLEGMVTQEEIVDWLLYDAAPWQGDSNELREESPGRYIADGSARVDHIADMMDLEIDTGGIDTIGGLVFNTLGYLPKPGERVKLDGVEIKVRRVSRRRVQQVELRRRPAQDEEELSSK